MSVQNSFPITRSYITEFQSGSYTLAEVASALNGQYPGEFDYFNNDVIAE